MVFNKLAMLLFIDAYLDTYEVINSTVLDYHFGVKRSTFTSLINEYKSRRPSMIRHEFNANGYVKSHIFERQFSPDTPSSAILEAYHVFTGIPLKTVRQIKETDPCDYPDLSPILNKSFVD
ncbi:hypothetical protein [Vibrio sp. R78045]|uniref:hypothetical protein n=1 Tax=Vibrio sp. R78045 TaxID=3093868 RepID=UPI0036F269C8